MSQWYAVRCATRRERTAHEHLVEHGFTAFLPCETTLRRLRRTQERIQRPLLPGYLFVLTEPQHFRQILDLDAVHQFVCVMGDDGIPTPMPIPVGAIIEIQAAERAGDYDLTRNRKIAYRPKRGDKVKVTAGPWLNFIGKVLDTPRDRRALVMLEGRFGRGVTLDVARLSAA